MTTVIGLSGCTTLAYYAQSTIGHLGVMSKQRAVDRLLEDPQTPADLRAKLRGTMAIRDFASRDLHLPNNHSYRSYADLGRDFVVWNVSAAPELSVRPVTWCYLVVGCVSYRGYYAQRDARQFADTLRATGLDVYVTGVRAYSTLGWFDDPLLNTMLEQPSINRAEVIFHELAHQQLYFPGDTQFNESFAVTVEREGVRRWLAKTGLGNHSRVNDAERALYQQRLDRRAQFVEMVLATKAKLDATFESDLSAADQRLRKRELYDKLRSSYAQMKDAWGGDVGYDHWFETDLNNAKLALVGTYNDLVPQLTALLATQHGDLQRFYALAGELESLDPASRRARLRVLIGEKRS